MGPRNPIAARLTTTRIEALPPRPTRYEVTDPGTEGLQLRVEPSGTRGWLFRYYWLGKRVRLALGPWPDIGLAEARERALNARRGLDRGMDPRTAGLVIRATKSAALAPDTPTNPHSVAALAAEFMHRHVTPRRKRPEYAARILQAEVLRLWADRDARSIRPREVVQLLDAIVDRGAPVMANRVAALLAQMFKFGIHRELVDDSPVKLLYRPGGREKARERVLSDDELRILLRNPDHRPRFDRLTRAITLLLLTGQRRGELGLARWADIDLVKATWRIPPENSKTGKGHVVPLGDWAVQEFKSLRREAERSPFVMPGTSPRHPADPKLLTRNMARAVNRFASLKVQPFTLHDLRRTCRTGLSRLKVEPHIAERVLNHAPDRIAGTYDLYDYLHEKRAALDAWAAYLGKLRE